MKIILPLKYWVIKNLYLKYRGMFVKGDETMRGKEFIMSAESVTFTGLEDKHNLWIGNDFNYDSFPSILHLPNWFPPAIMPSSLIYRAMHEAFFFSFLLLLFVTIDFVWNRSRYIVLCSNLCIIRLHHDSCFLFHFVIPLSLFIWLIFVWLQ